MAIIVTAVNEDLSIETIHNKKLFLAGGITNCPDWQQDMISKLKDLDGLTIFNPRRPDFDTTKPEETVKQIVWEFKHLKESDFISFWFSKGSVNPIVLYELGMYGNSSNKNITIGIDPEYTRKQDVMIQTKLARPDIVITEDFQQFIHNVVMML